MKRSLCRRINKTLFLYSLLFLFAVCNIEAATHVVTNRLDTGSGSLRTTVANAANGDSIIFHTSIASDSIVLTSGAIIIGNKSIIISGPGADKLIISAAGNSHLFEVSAGYSLSLYDISIHSGKNTSSGGAIINFGTLYINRCSFIANTSSQNGGAIYTEGMIYIKESCFAYNHADSNGGALCNVSGYVEIINSTFSANKAAKEGGGIYNLSVSSVIPVIEVVASTIVNNTAGTKGGGFASTFIDYRDTAKLYFQSSIVALNFSGNNWGHDVFRGLSSRCYVVSKGNNLIGNTDSSGMSGYIGDLLGNTVSPMDPLLLPLAKNGGLTLNHALGCNSPALDFGSINLSLTNDQRGLNRSFNGAPDIGAFESQVDLYLPFVDLGADIDTCLSSLINLQAGGTNDSVNWLYPDASIILANNKNLQFTSTIIDSIVAEVISPAGCPNYDTIIIRLVDIIKPVIHNCPTEIILYADSTSCSMLVNWTAPTASDNCNVDTFYSNYSPGDTFSTGTTKVVYTAIDDAGNKTECSFNVVVRDLINPQILCPQNIQLMTEKDMCHAFVSYTPPVGTDNCGEATTVLVNGLGPDTNFLTGIYIERWVVTDASGNKDSCEFVIEVIDNQPPSIICPNDIIVSTDSGFCYATVNYQITTSDNCPGDSLILLSGLPSGSQFPKGMTWIQYRVQDKAGNWDTCSFNIIVNDNLAPQISCAPLIESCTSFVVYDLPVFSDNCPGALMQLVSGVGSGNDFPIGSTPDIYEVEDAAGNTARCTIEVIVYAAPLVDAGNDTSIYLGDFFYLNPSTDDNLDFEWTPALYLNNTFIKHPLCEPEESITYTLHVESQQKCKASDSVRITVIDELFVPTVFTPGNADGRGTNDFWEIKGLHRYPDCIIRVYNLWGNLVYESKGYKEEWDGRSGDKELPAGNYYYHIELGKGEKPLTGNLMIIR